MTEQAPAGGASFYALGPEFEWLAAAWDGFARELAQVSGTLRRIVEAAAADPQLAAESSGLAALESASERLVRELVDDASRIRDTQTTYEQADAAVYAAVPAGVGAAGMHSAHTQYAQQPQHVLQSPPAMPQSPQHILQPPPQVPQPPQHSPQSLHPQHSHYAQDHQEPQQSAAPMVLAGLEAGPVAVAIPVFGAEGSGLWHPNGGPDLTETALGTLSRFRRQILARAEHWVAQRVPYNQGAYHEGYRTDCSGYVSMCWGLRDSLVTSTMPQIAHRIAKEQLRAGDVLLNTSVTSGHVIIFDRWADYAHNSYVGYELCPQGTLHHVIPFPYYGGFGVYEPYRYNNAGD